MLVKPLSFSDISLPLDDDAVCVELCKKIVYKCRPEWPEDEALCSEFFTAGITNRIFSVWPAAASDSGRRDRLVFRVYGRNTELIIDRKQEIETIQKLHAANCAPPLYATFGNGIVVGYAPGRTLTVDDVRNPQIYRSVASAIGRMHARVDCPSVISSAQLPMWTKVLTFIRNRPTHFDDEERDRRLRQFASSDTVAKQMKKLKECIGNCEIVFCHNDILMHNVLYDEEHGSGAEAISFIDYEYAMPNYYIFDIANHFNEYAGVEEIDFSRYPDEAHQIDWLTCYLRARHGREPARAEVEKLLPQVHIFSAISHFFWANWALVQAANSTIDFDFLQYALDRWTEYEKFAQRMGII